MLFPDYANGQKIQLNSQSHTLQNDSFIVMNGPKAEYVAVSVNGINICPHIGTSDHAFALSFFAKKDDVISTSGDGRFVIFPLVRGGGLNYILFCWFSIANRSFSVFSKNYLISALKLVY